jgi:hypothetical protein
MQIYNVLDAGAASTLIRADALDVLLAGGRRIIITPEVLEEIVGERPDLPNQAKFLSWFNDNQTRIDTVDLPITEADIAKYNPAGKLGQDGDISIKKFLDFSQNSGVVYEVISDDGDLIKYKGPGNFYTSESSIGFISDAALDKRINNADDYLRIKQGVENSGRLGQISSDFHGLLFEEHDIREFYETGTTKPGGFSGKGFKVAAVTLGAELIRQAGIVGDILSFGVTAAQASELRNNGDVKSANKVWVEYIFETAGGFAGGALGAYGALITFKGAGGFWGPLLGAITVSDAPLAPNL